MQPFKHALRSEFTGEKFTRQKFVNRLIVNLVSTIGPYHQPLSSVSFPYRLPFIRSITTPYIRGHTLDIMSLLRNFETPTSLKPRSVV